MIIVISTCTVYILKQWIALKAHSDWLVEYPLLFTSSKLSFCGVYYLTVLVQAYILKQLFTSVSAASGGYLPRHFVARY